MSTDTGWLRREYSSSPLRKSDVAATWPEQFARWFSDAQVLVEPNAMVLATSGEHQQPRARTVLLKSYGADGFVWASNYESRKGHDLAGNSLAGLCFPWHELQRQVHAEGPVERTSDAESDEIWGNRPRKSQLSALASAQSQILASREEIEQHIAELDGRYPDDVPRPAHWGGYRLRPERVEFWQGQRDRMHDRLQFRRTSGDEWVLERLSP